MIEITVGSTTTTVTPEEYDHLLTGLAYALPLISDAPVID